MMGSWKSTVGRKLAEALKLEFIDTDDKNLNHMMWKLRNTDDCIRYPFLLTFIRKLFSNSNPTNEKYEFWIGCADLNFFSFNTFSTFSLDNSFFWFLFLFMKLFF